MQAAVKTCDVYRKNSAGICKFLRRTAEFFERMEYTLNGIC